MISETVGSLSGKKSEEPEHNIKAEPTDFTKAHAYLGTRYSKGLGSSVENSKHSYTDKQVC